ncbi:MAG: hypothetical protein HN348_25115 [Proteobacteria bacterium]|nr:hypothetical protein [Pseudomonadota bacterium]
MSEGDLTATSVPPVAVGAAVVIVALGVATALVVAANNGGNSKKARKNGLPGRVNWPDLP